MSSGVIRRGSTVRRRIGPWTPTVHALLRHLEHVGFPGSPRVIGVDGDIEILTFIEGEVAVDPTWEPGHGDHLPASVRSDDALRGTASLLAEYHAAVDGFDPPEPGFRFHSHTRRSTELICHGDPGPWNTVYRQGLPVALIDWDSCQPLERIVDVAFAAWAYVPLAPPSRLVEAGFSSDVDVGDRLRVFVDTYGIEDRRLILPALHSAGLIAAERVRFWPISSADAAKALDLIAADLRWLDSMSRSFETSLR